jgi:hypothetical protein
VVDKDGWRLSTDPTEKLDQEEQDRLARLKSWLAKQMRRVRLPDLLIEVDNQLGFTRNFFSRPLSARSLRLKTSAPCWPRSWHTVATSASTRWRS